MEREAVHHMPFRAVRADVLGAREALADEAIHLRHYFAHPSPLAHRERAQAAEHEEREEREGEERDAGARVLVPHDDEDADEQEEVAEDVHDEAREERRERGDVAVDTLDELARGARLVKGEVETQDVEREIRAQRVRRGPAEVLTDVLTDGSEDLCDERDRHEGDREPREVRHLRAGGGLIDERSEQLRVQQLQEDARDEEDGKRRRPPPLRADIPGEEREVAARAAAHRPECRIRSGRGNRPVARNVCRT